MKVIVVGCGRFGAELAYNLYSHGHEVSVVDMDFNAFNNLPADFEGRECEGDALNEEVLRRAGIEKSSALVAATSSDALNLTIGHVAREIHHVGMVIARNYEPSSRPLYETFNIQVVSAASWGVQRIEEMLMDIQKPIFSAGNGEVEVYEVKVPAQWNGKTLGDLIDGVDAIPVALTRAGRAELPRMDQKLIVDDALLVSSTMRGIESLRLRVNRAE